MESNTNLQIESWRGLKYSICFIFSNIILIFDFMNQNCFDDIPRWKVSYKQQQLDGG